MTSFLSEQEKLKNPNYQIMELQGKKLHSELNSWTREQLINWLCWNDGNGVYKDVDSMREFNNILDKNEAIKIITRQITNC